MKTITDILEYVKPDMEVTIYDMSDKYTMLYDCDTAKNVMEKYGNYVFTRYYKYEDGVDIFIYKD